MLAILAQAAGNNDNKGEFGDIPPEMVGAFLAIMGCVLLVALVVAIFFLLTLSKALSRCSPRNRTMEPGMVWLNLIPLFNIVWQFITVNRVAESLKNEFYDRGWDDRGEDFGRGLGISYCILNLLGIIPYIGGLFGLIALVCFIIYWVKIANYSGQLANRADYDDDRGDDDRDDRDDDRRGRRRRRDDDYDDRDDRDERDDRDDRPWERR